MIVGMSDGTLGIWMTSAAMNDFQRSKGYLLRSLKILYKELNTHTIINSCEKTTLTRTIKFSIDKNAMGKKVNGLEWE